MTVPMKGCDYPYPTVIAKLDNCLGIDAHEKANLRNKYYTACYLHGRDSDQATERALNIAIRINEEKTRNF